jgi:hypothetical protein
MTDWRALAQRITAQYLKESAERSDAAQRAALARRVIDKSGSAETLESFYSDPYTALAAEFLETAGDDTSFGAMEHFMKRKFREQGGDGNN